MCHAPRIAAACAMTGTTNSNAANPKRRMRVSSDWLLLGAVLRKVADEIGVDAAGREPDKVARRKIRVAGFGERFHETRTDAHRAQLDEVASGETSVSGIGHVAHVLRGNALG